MTDYGADDPVRLIASIDPVDAAALPTCDRHAPARRLLARLLAGEGPMVAAPGSPRARRRLVAAGATVALLAGVGAAWVASRPATNPLDVACYAQPSLDGEVVGITPHGQGPVEACTEVWRTGTLAGRGPVPPLVGCVTPQGTAAVFPAESTAFCDTLGLDRLAVGPPGDEAVLGLHEALTEFFLAAGCVSPDDAVARVRAELEVRGLADWHIDNPGRYTPERPCASLSFDAASRTVTLVPFPARPASPTDTGGTTP